MEIRRRESGMLLIVAAFPLFFVFGESSSPYAYQPKILVQDGHLEFVGAEGRNISLRTSIGGYVNLNGDNLVQLVAAAKEASSVVENIRASGLTSMLDEVTGLRRVMEGPQGLSRRLAHLEGQVANLTRIGGGSIQNPQFPLLRLRRLARLGRRLSRVEADVQQIKTLLSNNECASSPCQNGGTCEDKYNDILCRCSPNWEGKYCESDVNECNRFTGTDLGCQNGATCVNKPGSYECNCPTGFFGIHCTQRSNDCTSSPSQEICGHGICIPQQTGGRGYTCICEQGWTTEEGRGPACTRDVNECAGNHPACSYDPPVPCINVPGSFHCGSCPPGFTGNGYYCTDIDECLMNNGGCSINPYVPCINTKGSRTCGSCPPGYQGDGTICIYTGVCQINNGGCHSLARCIDNPRISQSYVECLCPNGYTGNGIGPVGCQPISGGGDAGGTVVVVDPCSAHSCLNGGTCLAVTHTSATCRCRNGYTGPHCENVVNPCLINPCQNGGTCIHSTNGTGIACQCTQDYTGDLCQTQQQACGGTLTGLSGTMQFPPPGNSKYTHSTNCAWLLVTNSSKVLNVTFTKFNLEASSSCQFDWLQIHDGRGAGDHMVGRFCGSSLPKGGKIISTHNILYFWFRSDHSIAQDGFQFSWNSIDPVCGGIVVRESHGTVQSPGSPGKYPPNRDCYWTLSVPFGKRIQINFFTLQIEAHPNCSYDYLEVRDGSTESSPLLDTICNSTVPAPLITSGSSALLHFHSDEHGTDYGFQLTFSAVPGTPGCGGIWTAPTGEITSPNHPNTYRNDVNCEWLIRLPVGDKIKITFTTFSLEDSRTCYFDYLEIRDGSNQNSPLIARLCGTTVPRPYQSTGNVMFLQFKSDGSISAGGFHLTYETLCGGEFSDLSGILHSPFYPQAYPGSKECIYVISLDPGKAIQLEFQDFDMEDSTNCDYDYLQIHDGDYENSTIIGKYCGSAGKAPPLIISTFNHLWLKFKTDSSVHQRGFLANYTSIDRTCGGILKSQMGVLQSPQHPTQYPHNLDCIWIIKGDLGTIIQLTWQTFFLESDPSCENDHIQIFDGRNTENGALMGTFCGNNLPPALRTTNNIMTVLLHTDFSVAHDGFSAQYSVMDATSVCGGTYFTTMGVLMSPNYPNNYPSLKDCIWVLNVPYGQQIMLNVTDFQLEDNSQCSFDYLEIRNGGYETSPLIGKYCGENILRNIPSLSNQLYLRFVSDSSSTFRGFKILWDGTTTGCGGTLTSASGSIISPNYPQRYGESTECFWKITVSRGSKIQLVIVDLDIEENPQCEYDYIEIRDGSDSTGNLLGKYCNQNHPLHFISTGNNIWVKFRSDGSNEGRGFHLRYVSDCNVELKGQRGAVESPNFPLPYPLSLDCTWVITAPMGNSLNISFSHFDLESEHSSGCTFDYLEISEGSSKESPSHIFGKFCGNELPSHIASQLGHVFVHFVTDTSVVNNGFRLEWIVNGCGGLLEHPYGEISTPAYPYAYPLSTSCEWHIKLGYGESIELTVNSYDMESSYKCHYDYLKVYGGPDETSPLLAELCEKKNTPSVYTSSGNNMLVQFQSDSSFSGKGFKASYRSVPTRCGGNFKGHFGSIHSRNYPRNYEDHDDCQWLIEVEKHFVIKLIFVDFDIEAHGDCLMDYVKVFDGDSEQDHLLLNHCGRALPSPPELVSTGNKMLVRMKTDGSISAKGFLANYTIHCGAHITGELFGEISYHASVGSHREHGENCSWIIEAPSADDHVTLTISHLDVSPNYESEGECSMSTVEVRDGVDIDAPIIGSYCGSRIPPHITSSGSALYVHYNTTYGPSVAHFKAFYSLLNSACGGELTSEMGAIAIPGTPGSYPPNAECVWTIKTSPGNRVRLSFRSFNLEQSDNCDRDYLEIREGSSMGSLIGVYCGNSIPDNITIADKFWIKFRSDDDGAGLGFVADYSMLHGNDILGVQGQIASPLYPLPYLHEGEYEWHITVDLGNAISITFEDFYLDSFNEECHLYLKIHDGYDETSPVLFHGCGAKLPPSVTSSLNVVYIVWKVSPMRIGSWFLLNWIQVPRSFVPFRPVTNKTGLIPGCGGFFNVNVTGIQFTSPGYPDGYDSNMDCEWTFETTPSNHLFFSVIDMNLQQNMAFCVFDYVQIYNGLGNHQEWDLVKTYCLQNSSQDDPIQGSNLMKVVFHTDFHRNGTGFSAFVGSACGGSLSGSNGVINTLNLTQYFGQHSRPIITCEWNITVGRGKTIVIEFDAFDLSEFVDSNCAHNYLMFKNGGSPYSPILGNGRYCGSTIPEVPETVGNLMYIKYKTISGAKGFKLRFKEKSESCGGRFTLTPGSDSYAFSSPFYPQIPNPHTECEWIFLAPGGERINIDFFDRFDLTISPRCTVAYLELRNGGTENSPLIGRYCREMPGTQTSSENIIYVKFFTDVTDPRNGFTAKASLAKCDYIIRSAKGIIISPGYPVSYQNHLMCKWTIVGPQDHALTIKFEDLQLPEHPNCTATDNVIITEKEIPTVYGMYGTRALRLNVSSSNYEFWEMNGGSDDANENEAGNNLMQSIGGKRILGQFCGQTIPPPIEASANEVEVTFQSRATNNMNLRGFRLSFEMSRRTCGGALNGAPSGVFSSPGYPNPSQHSRICVWTITVPKGRRIRVEFIDFDLGGRRALCNQHISFHNGRKILFPIKEYCGKDIPEAVESSFETMLVYYWVGTPSNNRGFKARYTSDLSVVCEGDLNSTSGVITSPRVANVTSFYCEWERTGEARPNFTFAMTLLNSEIGKIEMRRCRYFPTTLYIQDGNDNILAEFCGNFTSETVVNPYHSTKIVAQQLLLKEKSFGINNFTLRYAVNECGGVLTGPHEVIASPNFPQDYPPNTDCAWALNYPDGQQIQLKFLNMDLEVDCSHDYISVRNGRSPRSPLIGKYCGNVIPANITSQSNHLWITFHSNLANQATGFKLTAEPMVGGCGGIFHGKVGEISSPRYPLQYPNNAECVWEIIVEDGYHIGLVFVNRFQLEQSQSCVNDYVEVFHFSNKNWVSLGKVCGRESSTSFNSTGKQMKVVFRSNEAVTGDGFMAQWSTNCGGTITSESGHVISPGYPIEYGKSLKCEYNILAPGKYITGEFKEFLLESGGPNCGFDNVTIYLGERRRMLGSSVLGPYCGIDKPPLIRSYGMIKIVFETDAWLQNRGFFMEYKVEKCGGYLNESTIISSPAHPNSYFGLLNCTWVIEAPQNQVVILTFAYFDLEGSNGCTYDWLSVYDSPVIEPTKRMARFCGNMTDEPPVVKSTSRDMVVQFSTDTSINFRGFRASVSFTYGEHSGCGGTMTLSHGSITSLRSPDIVGNDNIYEPFMDCHWLLIGAPQDVLHLDFKSMDLIPCNITSNSSSKLSYCECDFIEIRDGAGPFSEFIGKYCGSTTPQMITSSNNQLWLRFSTDSLGNGRGFAVDISSISSPCGAETVLTVSNVTRYLSSPNYPNDYPNNLRCRWLLTGEENFRLDIHFMDLDLEDSTYCENDWINIQDTSVSRVITEGFGRNLIYRGRMQYESVYMNSRAPMQKFKFCGVGHPSDFYSGTSNVEVSFITNSAISKRGFKLSYQFEGCNRNFTAEQGRILNSRVVSGSNCFITIQAQPNHTVSLYFNEFYFPNSEGCLTSGMEVHDGLADNAPAIIKLCGYRLPEPIFSTSSALLIKMWFSTHWRSDRYDITYTTTDKGRGCGGKLFNYGGKFTSPLYPLSMGNSSLSCRWEVSVPEGSLVALWFEAFDLGMRRSCDTDYLDVYDVDKTSNAEIFRAKYCGMDNPQRYIGASNVIIVQYVASINNVGRGWVIRFLASKSGAVFPRH